MKKHFTGVALFIFIVGASAFTASLFVEIPKVEVFEVKETVPRYESRKKCKQNYRKYQSDLVKVKVEQAIYNEKTGQLNMDFLIERDIDDLSEKLEINLHFFVQEPHGYPQFLTTERVLIKPEFKGDTVINTVSSIKLTRRISAFNNLYVIAEHKTGDENGGGSGGVEKSSAFNENLPAFDDDKATAVLIAEN